MLVLTCGMDEAIMIGDDVEIVVVEIRGDKVRLGFEAPRKVAIYRREIWGQIQRRREPATMTTETPIVENPESRQRLSPPDGVRMTSESIMQIIAALNLAQHQIKDVKRNQTADAGTYKYDYADLAAVYAATDQAQFDNGLSVFARIEGESLHVILFHTSGEWLDYGLWLLGHCTTHQQRGSALTYNRRYAESVIYKLAPEDDDGKAAGEASAARKGSPPPPRRGARQASVRPASRPSPVAQTGRRRTRIRLRRGPAATHTRPSRSWRRRRTGRNLRLSS